MPILARIDPLRVWPWRGADGDLLDGSLLGLLVFDLALVCLVHRRLGRLLALRRLARRSLGPDEGRSRQRDRSKEQGAQGDHGTIQT